MKTVARPNDMMKIAVLFLSLLLTSTVLARAEKVDEFHWTGVDRIVAIGDLHGDYEQYINVMRSAGLLNEKGKWIGGKTHLVQTGDITDRGPDSRKIIDHLVKSAKQAKRKGGYIHMLIGNHEAMNVVGDLRYVSEGEFEAFRGRNSQRLQEMQWQAQVQWMQANTESFEELDLNAYRQEWELTVPLGWVEHRQAWRLSGDYGGWVKDIPVAVQLNDVIFLHGGISEKYCKFTLRSMTEQVHKALEDLDTVFDSIVYDNMGPLWYRGLATEDENGVFSQTLDNILERYSAQHIVVGHTPTSGVVWPRFDQRVVANDTGISALYGGHTGILEITGDGMTAIYGDKRIPLPETNSEREAYLRLVIDSVPKNAHLKARLDRMLAPPVQKNDVTSETEAGESLPESSIPVPGTCQ